MIDFLTHVLGLILANCGLWFVLALVFGVRENRKMAGKPGPRDMNNPVYRFWVRVAAWSVAISIPSSLMYGVAHIAKGVQG